MTVMSKLTNLLFQDFKMIRKLSSLVHILLFILKISLFAVQSKFFRNSKKKLVSPLCINKFEVIAIHMQCIFTPGFKAWPES